MAINRFDRPVNLDYNYTPYMPELFMPDFNAIIKAGQVQDQITEESNKLASTKPNYIPTTQYDYYDEHGNKATKTFGDETAFRIYERKQRDWQDRLTKAKLSGDANVFNSERDRIADEVKQSMLPDGQFYNLETRYKNYATQLQNMQKEKSMDDAGYKTAGNYGHDLMNFYNTIGEYKDNTSQISSNFRYNITPYTDINKLLDENASHIHADGTKTYYDKVSGRFIVTDVNGVEIRSKEKIKQVLEPLLADPRIQQQLRVENYNRTTPNINDLQSTDDESMKSTIAQLDAIKGDTKKLIETAGQLDINANGKTTDQLYSLIKTDIEERANKAKNKYGSLSDNDRRAMMLNESFQSKYLNPNIDEFSYTQTNKEQHLKNNEAYLRTLDFDNAMKLEKFRKGKDGFVITPGSNTPEVVESLQTIQQNTYNKANTLKFKIAAQLGMNNTKGVSQLLSEQEFKNISPNGDYSQYREDFNAMSNANRTATQLWNMQEPARQKAVETNFNNLASSTKPGDAFLYKKVNEYIASGKVKNVSEALQYIADNNKTLDVNAKRALDNINNDLKNDKNLQSQLVNFTPTGQDTKTYDATLKKAFDNPAYKQQLAAFAIDKLGKKMDYIAGIIDAKDFDIKTSTIPSAGGMYYTFSWSDKSGSKSIVVDANDVPNNSSLQALFDQTALDGASDERGVLDLNNPVNVPVVNNIAYNKVSNLLEYGVITEDGFQEIKSNYHNENPRNIKDTNIPVFGISGNGGTSIKVTWNPKESIGQAYNQDIFNVEFYDASGNLVQSTPQKGSLDNVITSLGKNFLPKPTQQKENSKPILNIND